MEKSAEIRAREVTRNEYNAHAPCKPQYNRVTLTSFNFPESMLATVHIRMQWLAQIYFDGFRIFMYESANYVWILVPMVLFALICSLSRERNHFEVRIYVSAEQFRLPGLFVVYWKLRSLEGESTAPFAFARVLIRETRLFRRLIYSWFPFGVISFFVCCTCQIADETNDKTESVDSVTGGTPRF